MELDLRAARRMFGLDSIVFRPHNVYGERQHIGDRYRNVIGIFMNQLMRGEPMTIFGDGTQTRAFSYIGDVAPLIARAIDVPAALQRDVQRRRRRVDDGERAGDAGGEGDGQGAAHHCITRRARRCCTPWPTIRKCRTCSAIVRSGRSSAA